MWNPQTHWDCACYEHVQLMNETCAWVKSASWFSVVFDYDGGSGLISCRKGDGVYLQDSPGGLMKLCGDHCIQRASL